MKKRIAFALAFALVVVVATPLFAGEGEHKCSAEAQQCLNYFATKFHNRGWAGVDMARNDAGQLTISTIERDTPASRAGVKIGDVLLAINGVELNEANHMKLAEMEAEMVPGNTFNFTMARNGKERDYKITLTDMPESVVAKMVGEHMLSDHAHVEMAANH